ncbi:hypothetical protein DASC09_020010 [Saccharomycopsis crataegensis]|uniref:Ribosome maturation protein SDO1/SBDS N-terminal domain-containing protein n=1 Tax=Saccharomycopsis crataegensis TaxID=43959 RepID=A0AAV5QJ10_9ASCO|nr:hypothetical protein DASC09_020010 [Saccharomycopsis crataegensis]
MSSPPIRVFYKGDSDYSVFIDSKDAYEKYKEDSTVPLSDVISVYKVFHSRVGGNEGVLDEVSNQQLENEFGSSRAEDAILKILKEGEMKTNVSGIQKREWSSTNDAKYSSRTY